MFEILNSKNIVAVTATANVIKKLANVMSAGKVLVAHRTTASLGLVVRRSRLGPPVHPNFEDSLSIHIVIILEWTTSFNTSSRTLFVREGGREGRCPSGCPRHVERRVT